MMATIKQEDLIEFIRKEISSYSPDEQNRLNQAFASLFMQEWSYDILRVVARSVQKLLPQLSHEQLGTTMMQLKFNNPPATLARMLCLKFNGYIISKEGI